MKDTAAEVML